MFYGHAKNSNQQIRSVNPKTNEQVAEPPDQGEKIQMYFNVESQSQHARHIKFVYCT